MSELNDHDYCGPVKKLKYTSNTYCSVPQCNNRQVKGVSFHLFPQNKILKSDWARRLRIGKQVSKGMMVCSEHFEKDAYFPFGETSLRKRLKKDAVPTLRLPSTTHDKTLSEKQLANRQRRANRLSRRAVKAELKVDDQSEQAREYLAECDASLSGPANQPEMDAAQALLELQNALYSQANSSEALDEHKKTYADIAIQVTSILPQQRVTLVSMIHSDAALNSWTGIGTLLQLEHISQAAEMLQNYGKETFQLDVTERIVSTMVKIKLNLSFSCISVLFGISITTAIKYFNITLKMLSSLMEEMIIWPEKEDIVNNMPACFDKFRNTRIVLDCTESAIESPSCINCRISTWSHYKGRNTVKFMVGVAPEGLITFCSAAYGGKASDKSIYLQSNLMNKLIPHVDAIMSDKGFLVEHECAASGIKLIRPPFLGKSKQFTVSEGQRTAEIAQARVHVERSIQRIKLFKILTTQISWNLVAYADEIITVVAGLVNMQNPILAMDKF